MEREEILSKKKFNDRAVVAEMLGISRDNVTMILSRPRSKRHKAVLEAYTKVIESREKLLNKHI